MTCAVAALGGFLFGFDMAVVSGILPLVTKQFALSAFQQGWFVSSALVDCILSERPCRYYSILTQECMVEIYALLSKFNNE